MKKVFNRAWEFSLSDPLRCEDCGWEGTGESADIDFFAEVIDIYCPKCNRKLVLASIASDLEEVRREAAAGNPKARVHLPHLAGIKGPVQREREDAGLVNAPYVILSERFELALKRATEIHRDHARKGSMTPYVGHLLSVAGYVLEDGGSEDEAIAALLHDALEDRNRPGLLDELRKDFGPRVVEIVEGCSHENLPGVKLPWKRRKDAYLMNLDTASSEILRVSLADKLHNVRAILRDHRFEGAELWERFNADRQEILWYYRELAKRYSKRCPGPMADEFADEVKRLGRLK